MAQLAFKSHERNSPDDHIDWRKVAYLVHLSRALDEMEEKRLVRKRRFSTSFPHADTTWHRSSLECS